MKKRSFYAIMVVAIGLFISLNLVSFAVNYTATPQSVETGGGGNSSSLVNGVYVPD